MSKNELVTLNAEVIEVGSAATFKVKIIDSGDKWLQILGQVMHVYAAGKIKRNKVRIVVGDKVTVEASIIDLTRGRIVYRQKV